MKKELFRAVARKEAEFSVRPHLTTKKKLAAFACVADDFGYRFTGLAAGTRTANNPYYAFRRTPDADRRAAAALARHPHAMTGGQLPGMRPGGGFRPDRATRERVGLFHAQLVIDATTVYRTRVVRNLVGLLVLAVVVLAVQGFPAPATLISGGVGVALLACYFLGAEVGRRRRARKARLLASAGWDPL
ncbi:hypothetical protein [Streptomyces sp. NPDC007088]|uniref:hypothetical protein n=1 Tax=Streptomyces sp. NPDC007088 TaxID=3364773 RepID=UPI0036953B75